MGFPELFEKTICPIHFIPGIYPYGVSLLTLDPNTFPCSWPHFRLSGGQYLAENGVSGTFWKKMLAQFISYLAFTLMELVSWPQYIFVFLGSFSALWWLNIWPKMGFPELFEKPLAQFISYLAFILMGLVSWPLYIFVFLASFSALWWPNIGPKIGFLELKKKYGLN